jgi:hypothetical protein
MRQPTEASGLQVEGCILSQTHFLSNLATQARPPSLLHSCIDAVTGSSIYLSETSC